VFNADKTKMIGLPCGKETLKKFQAISIEYRNVTNRQTDRRTNGGTDRIAISVSRARQCADAKFSIQSIKAILTFIHFCMAN